MNFVRSSLAIVGLLLLLVLQFGATAHASSREITGQDMEYLIDPDHAIEIDDLVGQTGFAWQTTNDRTPAFGFSPHTYWFRFDLRPNSQQRFLQVDYALLDDISIYRVRDNQVVNVSHAGDDKPFKARELFHRSFLFRLPSSDVEQDVYIRVRSTSSIQLPVFVWDQNDFFSEDQYRFVEHGIYYGIVLVMAVYSLFLFLRLRDSAYAFYVIYVLTFALTQMSLSGFSYQFVWPEYPAWNRISVAVLTPLICVSGIIFVINFLKLDTYHPRLFRFVFWQAVAGLLVSAYATFGPYSVSIRLGAFLAITTCISILITGYYVTFKDKHKYATYFTAAWSVFLLGTVVLAMNKFGILPRTFITESAAQFGSALEIILLSFALAERLHDANNRRFVAEKAASRANEKLVEAQRSQNEFLESQVELRTKELSQALDKVKTLNEELHDLSTLDQVTGVRNRRYFDELLEKEFRRAARNHSMMSLIFIDLDHFKRINDEYGHLAGDAVLKHVAAALYRVVKRPPDLVCRYGGEELAVILPETHAEGAQMLAERMRAEIEALIVEHGGEEIRVTGSLGVCTMVPQQDDTIARLINRADDALYEAKRLGRNKVVSAVQNDENSGEA